MSRGLFKQLSIFWSENQTGYQDELSGQRNLVIDSFFEPTSEGYVTLGQAGPVGLFFNEVVSDGRISEEGLIWSENASVPFYHHLDEEALSPLAIPRGFVHVIGIGTLWEREDVLREWSPSEESELQREFQPLAQPLASSISE